MYSTSKISTAAEKQLLLPGFQLRTFRGSAFNGRRVVIKELCMLVCFVLRDVYVDSTLYCLLHQDPAKPQSKFLLREKNPRINGINSDFKYDIQALAGRLDG